MAPRRDFLSPGPRSVDHHVPCPASGCPGGLVGRLPSERGRNPGFPRVGPVRTSGEGLSSQVDPHTLVGRRTDAFEQASWKAPGGGHDLGLPNGSTSGTGANVLRVGLGWDPTVRDLRRSRRGPVEHEKITRRGNYPQYVRIHGKSLRSSPETVPVTTSTSRPFIHVLRNNNNFVDENKTFESHPCKSSSRLRFVVSGLRSPSIRILLPTALGSVLG